MWWPLLLRKIGHAVVPARFKKKCIISKNAKNSDVTVDLEREKPKDNDPAALSNKNPPKTRKKSLDLRRKQTDLLYIQIFGVLFFAWIVTILSVICSGSISKYQLVEGYERANESESAIGATEKSNVTKFFDDSSSSSLSPSKAAELASTTWADLGDYLKTNLPTIITSILVSLALLFIVLAPLVTIRVCTATLCRLATILLLLCATFFFGKSASLHVAVVALLFVWSSAYKARLRRRPYVDTARILTHTPGTLQFCLSAVASIAFFVTLTIAAVAFTTRTDPLRYLILLGSFYALDFVLRFVNMVFALITTTYHQTLDVEELKDCRVWRYAGIVASYHLGTIAFSVMRILPFAQSLTIVLRHAFIPTQRSRNQFHQILYRLHLALNLSDYAEALVAKYGCGHDKASWRSCSLLIKFCSLSSAALNRALDEAIGLGLLLACTVKVLVPVAKSGVTVLSWSPSYCSEFSIWITLGVLATCIYALLIVKLTYTSTEHATRLCLLEQKLDSKWFGQVMLSQAEFNLCLDACTCRNRKIVFTKVSKVPRMFVPLERIEEEDDEGETDDDSMKEFYDV